MVGTGLPNDDDLLGQLGQCQCCDVLSSRFALSLFLGSRSVPDLVAYRSRARRFNVNWSSTATLRSSFAAKKRHSRDRIYGLVLPVPAADHPVGALGSRH
jgi:hypothetical protein